MGEEPVITRFNYFLGKDKSKWAGNCSGFRAIKYKELYPKTDLHLYNGEDGLKYDLVLQPGAELKNIAIEYTGLDDIFIENGLKIIKVQRDYSNIERCILATVGHS